MKVKLITGAGGSLGKNKKPKCELKNYSLKQGFDFDFAEYKDNYKLNKLYQIRETLKQNYTYVIWVDYDIRILDYSVNIMDYINKSYDINLCSHQIYSDSFMLRAKNKFRSFDVENTGVLVFKNSKEVKKFVDEWIKLTEKYYYNFKIVDNGAFLNIIGKSQLIDNLYHQHKKVISYKYNKYKYKLFYNVIPNNFNYVRNANKKIDQSMPIVIEHFAGVINREEYLR